MLVPAPELERRWRVETWNGVRVIRLKTLRTKDVGYVRRTIGELLMPFSMLRQLRRSPLRDEKWDGVVWYSPTIFLGPIARALKTKNACRSYLIIRDIFPEWAVDMGMMGRGLPYFFFRAVADYQYSVADVIGVQSPGNRSYFDHWLRRARGRVEVLQNWLAETPVSGCGIDVGCSSLAGRKIFVYAGNMGVAQGMGTLLALAQQLQYRQDIGFLFVGRGSDAQKLRAETRSRGLTNVLFHDEIDPDEIPGLYAQCHAGLVALDLRHKTHNVPGKFLSYMQAGLPVLAVVNPGNDLVQLIRTERVGRVCTDADAANLADEAVRLLEDLREDGQVGARCKALAVRVFSPEAAAKQIVQALEFERELSVCAPVEHQAP